MNERERLTNNDSINDDLHEMLTAFQEPSRSRMLKRIRQDRDAIRRNPTEDVDANARHTFREFLPAYQLLQHGLLLEYGKSISGLTPDWLGEKPKLLLEVFTCERGGTSNPVSRTATSIREKTLKYKAIAEANALPFVLGIYGDFASGFDEPSDCEEALAESSICDEGTLSGVIFFTETRRVKTLVDGKVRRKQLYRYDYLPNAKARRPIDLTAFLANEA